MNQAARPQVVAEHPVRDGVQEHVRAVGEKDVDIAAHQARLLLDGTGKLLPGLRAGIEDAELTHA